MFVITMLYSVVQPLIVIFGAIYFGVGYVVYKYKLLFGGFNAPCFLMLSEADFSRKVFYKPYESQGQAWPITFIRLIWSVVIFLLFMTGIFTLRKSFVLSSLLLPLLLGTLAWSWYVHRSLRPLSKYVSLSSVFEVQRGEETAEVMALRAGHPVTWSQSNLSRRRYAQNDDTLYVAPEEERTDYVCFSLFLSLFVLLFIVVATSHGKLVQWCPEVSPSQLVIIMHLTLEQHRKTPLRPPRIKWCTARTLASTQERPNPSQ